MSQRKTTILDLQRRKTDNIPITMTTAYDYHSARLASAAGIDTILVGDSLGMTMLGYDSTVPVTMADMLRACQAVARGNTAAFTIGDMPFMSYQVTVSQAIANAGLLLQEGGVESVKLEGGAEMAETIAAIVRAGIPVLGHIGLTPQSVSQLGGYRVQGKTAVSAHNLLTDALALQDAGCFGIVLEAVPALVATAISQRLTIPTIGIGAGAGCDGQVLVWHDLLGLSNGRLPRFVQQYADLSAIITAALTAYRDDVTARRFPAEAHTYPMDDAEAAAFRAMLAPDSE